MTSLMTSLKLTLSHAGPRTLHSRLSNTPSTPSDSSESESDRLRTQLDIQAAIAAQYEEDLSARDQYVELLSVKLKHAEKTAERWRREAEKDKVLLSNVQEVLEQECEGLEDALRTERAVAASGNSSNPFAASHRSRPGFSRSVVSATSSVGDRDVSDFQSFVGRSATSRQDISEEQPSLEDYGARSSQISNASSKVDVAASIVSEPIDPSLRSSQPPSAPPPDHELFQRQAQQLEAVVRERDQLLLDLEDEKASSQRLAASLSAADNQLTISASAFATAKETIKELQAKERDHLRAREAAEEQLASIRQELEARVTALVEEAAGLRSKHGQELDRLKSVHRAAEQESASREESYRAQVDDLQEQIEDRDSQHLDTEDRLRLLTAELEGMKRNVETL
ncbi:hypothetical protein FRC04_003816, partial [Tulasnella sp. 424]